MAFKEIKLPDLGEGVTEGELIKIKVKKGDSIAMDQVLLEVMTDKASMEVPSSIEGQIVEVKVQEGSIVSVGQVIFLVKMDGEEENEHVEEKKIPQEKEVSVVEERAEESKLSQDMIFAAPSTRKLAKEFGVSLKEVKASGTKGEVLRSDLIRHVQQNQAAATSIKKNPAEGNLPEGRREPLRGIKRIMFDTMSYSKQTIPHFTIIEQAQVTQLMMLRKELKQKVEKENIKVTYLSFIMRAILSVLKEFPILNSAYDEETKEIVYSSSVHFGVAVDTPKGLLVPVIKEAQNKTLLELAKELQRLGEEAREGTLKREDLKGGTFSFTNLGSLSGIAGTPIIQSPQVAILGIYRLYNQVIRNSLDEWQECPHMNFSLTCDHRLIDGATAARFLKKFVMFIEEPALLILD